MNMSWRALGTLVDTEEALATPGLVTAARTSGLPHVVVSGEENDLTTALRSDGLDGSSLLRFTRAGDTVADTLSGPTALQVEGLLAGADLAEDLELGSDELSGILGGGIRVEVGVHVGTGNIDEIADSSGNLRLLPDVEGLSNGVGTSVRVARRLDVSNELSKLASSAVAVLDSLVGNDNELDNVPVGPRRESLELLLDVRGLGSAASLLDEDTNNELQSVLHARVTDILKTAAVSGVETDNVETGTLDGGDIRVNLVSSLAVTGLRDVRSIGKTVTITAATEMAAVATGGRRSVRLAAVGGRRSIGLGAGRRSDVGGGRRGRLEGAVGDILVLSDGDGLSGSRVSSWDDGGGNHVGDDGLRGAVGGGGSNGVGAGAGADVGGGLDDAGGDRAAGVNGGVGASHSGGLNDNGGDTSNGVASSRHGSGLRDANGGAVLDSDGGCGPRVGARRGARVNLRSWEAHSGGGGRRRRRSGGNGNLSRSGARSSGELLGGG